MSDVYFRADYAEVAASVEHGEAHVLERDGVIFPIVVRSTADGVRDVTNPYGYGGALAADADAAGSFYEWYGGACREQGRKAESQKHTYRNLNTKAVCILAARARKASGVDQIAARGDEASRLACYHGQASCP